MLKAEYYMRERGITQADIARSTGIARTTINKVIHGQIPPYPKYRKAFAVALEWNDDPGKLFEAIEEVK